MDPLFKPGTASRLTAISLVAATLLGFAAEPVRSVAAQADAGAAVGDATVAQWKTQKLRLDFTGFTTKYTCDGLEDKVRSILRSFGARKDMKVNAYGCARGPDRPTSMIWVDAEFSALAPLPEDGTAAVKPEDTVKANWVKVRLAPRRPWFMGEGECELVEQMHDMLQKGFVLRNASYSTACVPHEISVGDYSVSAEVMKPIVAK